MPTHDFIYDLLEKIESQDINYHLITIEKEKNNEQNIHIFTSLDEKEQSALLKFLKKAPSADKKIDKGK
jgi:disulfide oxidoreductase YuzD